MALETKKRDIGGVTFATTKFPAYYQVGLLGRLIKLIGPGFAGLFQGGGGIRGLLQKDVSSIGSAIKELAMTLEPEEFQKFALDLLANTDCGSNRISGIKEFNAAFESDIGDLWEVLLFVLEENSFFGLGAIGKRLAAKLSNPKNFPENSNPVSNSN